jgi:hypothetical protein
MFWCHVTIVSLESKLDVLGPKIESCDVQVSAARIFSGSLNLLGVLDPVLPVICNLADEAQRSVFEEGPRYGMRRVSYYK